MDGLHQMLFNDLGLGLDLRFRAMDGLHQILCNDLGLGLGLGQ